MFVHLGENIVVKAEQILTILNLEQKVDLNNCVFKQDKVYIGKAKYKSMIVTEKKIYYSPISSMTIKNRADSFFENIIEN